MLDVKISVGCLVAFFSFHEILIIPVSGFPIIHSKSIQSPLHWKQTISSLESCSSPTCYHLRPTRIQTYSSIDTRDKPFDLVKSNLFPTLSSTAIYSASSSSTSSSSDSSNDDKPTNNSRNKLDEVLSSLTSAFPFFVLAAACMGVYAPSTLSWVGGSSNLIPIMLSSVMMGTGMTLEKSDFTNVLNQNFVSVPMGILSQFIIMPLSAYLVGHLCFLLPQKSSSLSSSSLSSSSSSSSAAAALYLGLVLVGCSPGGTASNLVSLIAGADLALSVLLTACSTMMASFVTPVLVQILMKYTLPNPVLGSSFRTATATATATTTSSPTIQVQVSGITLCMATAKVVLLPVLLGMFINEKFPTYSKAISRFTPFASVLLVALICGGVVAQNVSSMAVSSSMSMNFIPSILKAVLFLHSIGFMAGYFIPKFLLRRNLLATSSSSSSSTTTITSNKDDDDDPDGNEIMTQTRRYRERTSRTISIETGMQNSALAVVLARSVGADPLASLPGALSATVHSCLGSILAAYWRYQDERFQRKNNEKP